MGGGTAELCIRNISGGIEGRSAVLLVKRMGGIVGIERVVVIFPERGRESAYHMSGPGEIHHMTVGVSRVHNLTTEHLMRLLDEWAFTLCIT